MGWYEGGIVCWVGWLAGMFVDLLVWQLFVTVIVSLWGWGVCWLIGLLVRGMAPWAVALWRVACPLVSWFVSWLGMCVDVVCVSLCELGLVNA